jgi:hypothetical protein
MKKYKVAEIFLANGLMVTNLALIRQISGSNPAMGWILLLMLSWLSLVPSYNCLDGWFCFKADSCHFGIFPINNSESLCYSLNCTNLNDLQVRKILFINCC